MIKPWALGSGWKKWPVFDGAVTSPTHLFSFLMGTDIISILYRERDGPMGGGGGDMAFAVAEKAY